MNALTDDCDINTIVVQHSIDCALKLVIASAKHTAEMEMYLFWDKLNRFILSLELKNETSTRYSSI